MGPRELRALSGPSSRFPVAARLGAGKGARITRIVRCGWSCATRRARRVRAGRAAGSACASEVGSPADPPCRGPGPAARAAPRRARRLWPCATEAPPPPLLSARPSPPGRAEQLRTAVSAIAAPGSRPRSPVAAYVREAKPRGRRGKKKARGRKGKNFIFFFLFFSSRD